MSQEFALFRFVEQLDANDRFRVVRGVDARDGRAVVLKQPRDPLDAARLELELTMLRSLPLPGVVRPLGIVATQGVPSLMLEDSGGCTLEAYIATGSASLETKLELAQRLAAIIDGIHRGGVVNRNIRPSTILWNERDDRLEILDFSLATRATRDLASRVLPNAFVGTAHYVAPEQTGRLDLVVDRRSDLYALGATLYHLFTGRPPFEGGDIAALLHAHMARLPERADKLAADLPPMAASILAKLLLKDPDDRYQTASGLLADLRRVCAGAPTFELGGDDAPTVLRVRETLVGRETELGQLETLTRDLAAGRRTIAYVHGEAGSGKSALLLEFARSVVRKGGAYARGKCELAILTSPYHPIAQIFEALTGTLLAQPGAALDALRDRLEAAMGSLAPALVDVFPGIRPLFRDITALEVVSPAGSHHRLVAAFLAFLGAIARSQMLTVLAVDDLQWADDASLSLLEALVQDASLTTVGLVLAARSDEVVSGSRVACFLTSLEATGAQVERVTAPPLAREAVATILADALRTSLEAVEKLSHVVWQKTHGNPFFVRALLESAIERGFVHYQAGFIWDEAALAASPVAENVASLLAERLQDLPAATREALTIAARLGEPIEADYVGRLLGLDEAGLLETLGPAIDRGMVLRAGSAIRFAHDRVVEASLALAAPERAQAIHARLSAVLLERSDEGRFFEAVDHLWLAGEPEDEAERGRRSSLALAAALRARRARAFAAAERYFERYASMMATSSFLEHFDATFDAHLAWAEAAFLAGSYERAQALCAELERRARNAIEHLRVRRILISYYEKTNRFVEAIRLSFATLAEIDVILPDHEAITPADVQAEVSRFLERFALFDAKDLRACPSRATREAVAMLFDVAVPLWSARVDALPLVVARAGTLSLEHGFSPASGAILVVLGSVLCIALGDATVGTAVAKLGLEVQERVGSADYEAFTGYAYFAMVQFHSDSARLGRDGLLASYHRSLAVGSRRWAAAAMESYAQRGALIGLPLSQVAQEVDEGRSALLRLEQEGSLTFFETLRHFVERVLEREETPWDLGPRRTDANSALAHFRQANHGGLIAVHTTLCMLELLASGDEQAAYAIAKADQEALLQPRGQLQTELGVALFALVSARCAPADDEAAEEEIARAAERFERSARFEATSFGGYHALVDAARLDRAGVYDAAWTACDRAIGIFERDSVLHLLALANELAARIHRRAGRERVARFYQAAAHRAYERWGAPKATRRLEAELGLVVPPPPVPPGATAASEISQVDTISLLKATRVIAGEIELDRLITTLLPIVAENAGANRAYLFLDRDGKLELEGRCDAELSVVRALPGEGRRAPDAPFAIATLVARTREPVLHEDASIVPTLASDPYLAHRGRVAVLAAPIERLGKVAGVIVLENDLVVGAFTAHHVKVVAALNAQIAVALENAALYDVLRARAASLAQSEERFRRLTENSLAGIYIAQDGVFVYVNPAMERILGAEPGTLVGTDFQAIIHPDDVALVAERVRDRVERSVRAVHYEVRALKRDGSSVWLEVLGSTMPYKGRLALLGNLLDVTARKEAERKQVELAAIVESSSDAIIGKTRAGIITSWNRGAERMFGYAATEAIGQSMLLVIPTERRDEEAETLAKIALGETVTHYETVRVRKDGRQIYVSATISPLKDRHGQVIGASKIARDISEQKRAAAELTSKTAMLEAQVDSTIDAILVVDEQGRSILKNGRFSALFKVPEASDRDTEERRLLEHAIEQFKEPERFRERAAHLHAHPDEIGRDEIELIDGRILDRYSAPVRDKAGTRHGRIWAFRDITEHRQLEESLRGSAEEIRQLYMRLATAEDDERRALHGELHDQVGANLAALRLELEVALSLLAREDSASTRRHLTTALGVAAETIAMARDLMAELRPPALDDYGLLAALRIFAETQSLRLALPVDVAGHDLSPRPNRLVEDALFRVAQEAVINAARHASASRIAIELRGLDAHVQLSISDDGVGFDLDVPAAGLDHWGLKNMRERARAVGGELRITTAPGAGTRVTAHAPRAGS